jgi:hypothetical protein
MSQLQVGVGNSLYFGVGGSWVVLDTGLGLQVTVDTESSEDSEAPLKLTQCGFPNAGIMLTLSKVS